MAKLPKSLTQPEQQAMQLVEYMMENYPEYHYSDKEWIESDPKTEYFNTHHRIFELEVKPDISIMVDADFQPEEVGQLVDITVRYVLEELEEFDWNDIKVLFR